MLRENWTPVTDQALRDKGLVYLDTDVSDAPAAHVLLIGVGRYQAASINSVTSPPASARAIADWFLGQGEGPHFHNRDTPLGSLAITLSEQPDAAQSDYLGAVPRATHARTKAVMSDWVNRINSHKDNIAILYVCSHGQSIGARTAYLLEDYGTVENDATAGASEVEQLVRALSKARPVKQILVFDCCRTKVDLDLPEEEEIGSKLISLTTLTDDHGEPRQQWLFAATTLGEEATGRKNKTTIFTDSLLRALQGAAADPSHGDWRISPMDLARTIPKILDLHKSEARPRQKPAGQFADAFPLTFCEAPASVQTYVSLADQTKWAGCQLTITVEGAAPVPLRVSSTSSERFLVHDLPEMRKTEIAASAEDGTIFDPVSRLPRAPATFVVIDKEKPASITTSPLSQGQLPSGKSMISVNVGNAIRLDSNAVVRMTRLDAPEPESPTILPDAIGRQVDPGTWRVAIDTPDGRNFATTIRAMEGSNTEISFSQIRSPTEWLGSAVTSGLVAGSEVFKVFPGKPDGAGPKDPLLPVDLITASEACAGLGWRTDLDTRIDVELRPIDSSTRGFQGFNVTHDDEEYGRYWSVAWARVGLKAGFELSALPYFRGAQHTLVLDKSNSGSTTTYSIDAFSWTALIAYLARRDFASGEVVSRKNRYSIQDAIYEKMENPFGAVAGGLIAVGSTRFEHFDIPLSWLFNLAYRFPGIPDGPIILARQLTVTNTRHLPEFRLLPNLEILPLLRESYSRGVPAFALSLEWLAEMLDEYGTEEDAHARRAVRRALSALDPTMPFTTLKFDQSDEE